MKVADEDGVDALGQVLCLKRVVVIEGPLKK